MKRFVDWDNRLNQYLAEATKKEFDYAEHNCAHFAAGAVEAMTGEDPMEEFRGKFTNEKEAREALKTYGGGSLFSTLRRKFGNPVNGAHAKRGDLAYHDKSLGVVSGNGKHAIFFGENGFVLIRLRYLQKAFHVPFEE